MAILSSEECTTFPEVLARRAEVWGERTAYLYLDATGNEAASYTLAELDHAARAIAAGLERFGRKPVLLVLPNGVHFVAGFFGCLRSGAVAVPVPYFERKGVRHERLASLAKNAGAVAVITDQAGAQMVRDSGVLLQLESMEVLTIESLVETEPVSPGGGSARPQDLAFLQYTSGSTGMPKGVMVSHENLIDNVRRLSRLHGLEDSYKADPLTFVSWLPMFHDMGLIAGVLQSCYHGARAVVMDPATFVRSPLRWLDAISKYRGFYSMSPSFGYDLCVNRLTRDKTQHLDLSCWRFAVNGAEPISLKTIERFTDRFSDNGFSRRAMNPGYGLAEATLVVSSREKDKPLVTRCFDTGELARETAKPIDSRGDAEGRVLVSSGHIYDWSGVRIVDESSRRPLPDGKVGEIWVRTPSVARGYWKNPEETQRVFGARLQGAENDECHLRTGDLGFILDSELYVVGRLKDLIVLNGHNVYPSDIEATVREACSEIRGGDTIAFSVEHEERERVVVVQGLEPQLLQDSSLLSRLRQTVCEHVYRHEGVTIHDVAFVHPRLVLKTSSGKLRRRDMKEMYVKGELGSLARGTAVTQ